MAWYAKSYGSYAKESNEAIQNAVMLYRVFSSKGFNLNSICGVLGNVGWEGGYNPWRWQGDVVLSTLNIDKIRGDEEPHQHAYGLFQFDPASTYVYNQSAQSQSGFWPNFSNRAGHPEDGQAQCLCVSQDLLGGYYSTTAYPLTFQQYKTSTQTPEYLAMAWLRNYERGSGHETDRQADARYWFGVLPRYVQQKSSKWIYYMKRRRF